MRIGYFGGSFDPPHRAHLLAAILAQGSFGLDHVLLAPTGRQPLKTAGAAAPFADRLRMVQLLCEGHPGLLASAIDGPHPDGEPNYTVDTLRALRASLHTSLPGPSLSQAGADTPPELFAIVGADAFLGLPHWRDPAELLRLAQWVVISRPGFALDAEALHLTPTQRSAVHLLPGLRENLSATGLRRRLHDNEDCRTLIPPKVLAYLQAHNLYR